MQDYREQLKVKKGRAILVGAVMVRKASDFNQNDKLAELTALTESAGAIVVEVNPIPTSLSSQAHFSLRATAADALTAIAADLVRHK